MKRIAIVDIAVVVGSAGSQILAYACADGHHPLNVGSAALGQIHVRFQSLVRPE